MVVKRKDKTELTSKLHGERFRRAFDKEFGLKPLENRDENKQKEL